MKICVLGGGTAGLISALILKQTFPKFNITIIKSDKEGIIGVGESTTEHIGEFIEYCNININELIRETDALFKVGILFKDWSKQDFLYNVSSYFHDAKIGQYNYAYSELISKNKKPIYYTHKESWENKLNPKFLINQFNFNTFKLNTYLLKLCKQRHIKIVEDLIKKVNTKNNKITTIVGKKKYNFDFYIDCSGFKKVLISNLKVNWISYKKYLPLNEAIAFPTEDTKTYPVYTISKKMKYGWMWRTPTYGRWGNGYVYNNNYINKEKAQKECEEYSGHKINIFKNIKFEAGCLEKSWIGNCVAIGLSSSFIEPLEASAIGSGIQQSFLLTHLIVNYNDHQIKFFNSINKKINENIRDFIVLHYLHKKYKNPIPETLRENLNKWKTRPPIKADFNSDYLLFYESNFLIILKELGLIDSKMVKKYQKHHQASVSKIVNHFFNFVEKQKEISYTSSIDHKAYISQIRNRV